MDGRHRVLLRQDFHTNKSPYPKHGWFGALLSLVPKVHSGTYFDGAKTYCKAGGTIQCYTNLDIPQNLNRFLPAAFSNPFLYPAINYPFTNSTDSSVLPLANATMGIQWV